MRVTGTSWVQTRTLEPLAVVVVVVVVAPPEEEEREEASSSSKDRHGVSCFLWKGEV